VTRKKVTGKRDRRSPNDGGGEASVSTHSRVKEEESKIEIHAGQPLIVSYQTKQDDQKGWPEINLSREPQRPVVLHSICQV
jgi:hypothetical protein